MALIRRGPVHIGVGGVRGGLDTWYYTNCAYATKSYTGIDSVDRAEPYVSSNG